MHLKENIDVCVCVFPVFAFECESSERLLFSCSSSSSSSSPHYY